MANKNTRAFQRAIATAAKKGQSTVTRQQPAPGYHNSAKPSYVTQTATTCGKSGVVSESPARNTRMGIAVNKNEDGTKYSGTYHEKINSTSPIRGRHKYIKNYR